MWVYLKQFVLAHSIMEQKTQEKYMFLLLMAHLQISQLAILQFAAMR